MRSRNLLAGAVLAACAGFGLSSATAAPFLYVDLVPQGQSTAHQANRTVTAAPAATVSFDLYFKVLNTSAGTEESVNSTQGGFVSTGALSVTSSSYAVSPFNDGLGYKAGTVADLDGDGDLDQGAVATATIGQYVASFGTLYTTTNVGTETIGGYDYTVFKVGGVSATINGLTGETYEKYIARNATSGFKFKSDGITKLLAGNAAATSVDQSGASVLIQVPEPATMSFLGISALGLLARRRK